MAFAGISLLTFATALLLLGIAELVASFSMAPEGYEDLDGFHVRYIRA
jgi:hypothetical protein